MRTLKVSQSITNRNDAVIDKFLSDISKYPLLTIDEEVELAERIHTGDRKALDKLVRSNLRFVVSVAKQYQNADIPLSDLISEGTIGLIKAAERFDETRGFKFISYAVNWIRQGILQALANQSRTIRIPINKNDMRNQINKAISQFENENERKPTSFELAEITGFDESDIIALTCIGTVSIDKPFQDDDNESNIGMFLADDNAPTADSSLDHESLDIDLAQVMSCLAPREIEIIKRSFGIGCKEMTSDEIALMFGLSKERVRQIRSHAIDKLSIANGIDNLRKYIA